MILRRTMNNQWLSNTWLVFDRPGGHAVLVDTGGPTEPVRSALEENRLTLSHILCTHHHYDHVTHNREYQDAYGCPVCGHTRERELFGALDVELQDGDELVAGDLHVRALHIPGHTLGQLAFVINDERVFTGDTLFAGSVGGTRAPGHTNFEDLQHSIMDVLMKLPKDMPVHPGHMAETTVGQEWETNPFVRAWRGVDALQEQPCTAYGEDAMLLLDAEDYDGGRKCQVRFADGRLDVVPGSKVRR